MARGALVGNGFTQEEVDKLDNFEIQQIYINRILNWVTSNYVENNKKLKEDYYKKLQEEQNLSGFELQEIIMKDFIDAPKRRMCEEFFEAITYKNED